MRNWRVIFDRDHLQGVVRQTSHGAFAARTWTLHTNFHFTHAQTLDLARNFFSGATGGEWSALASALETNATG